VDLVELHVLQRNSGTQRHGHAVAGVDQCVARGAVHAAVPAGSEHGRFRLDHQRLAGLDLQHQRTDGVALVIHQQINRKKFIKEVRLRPYVLLIERMQHGVTGAIGRGARTCGLRTTEVQALSAKRPLVNAAVFQARKRHTIVFELDHDVRRRVAHVFDGILITKIVASLDGVIHVPVPVIR
jgi:hypothetical protein